MHEPNTKERSTRKASRKERSTRKRTDPRADATTVAAARSGRGSVSLARLAAVLVLLGLGSALLPASADEAVASLPQGWPRAMRLGMANGLGGARDVARSGLHFRYQYLSGGVNTGQGWATWNPDGHFVTSYVAESMDHRLIPAFTYYMLQQSEPGGYSEAETIRVNLLRTATMRAYFRDLKLFLERAGAFPEQMVVLHVEPDLWGFAQQMAEGDDATSVPAMVAATGLLSLRGFPDDLSGFARAIVRLRDALAPNVVLAYHLSVWGTGVDIALADPEPDEVHRLADKAAAFYQSLDAHFDLVFTDVADRDAAFKQHVSGDGGASWWDEADFRRNVRFLARFVTAARRRVVIWQIPLGNTKMRAMNNTWDHYQDNRVQWLLGGPGRQHLRRYIEAGVVALLFGRGGSGATCGCDAAGDGVTNPRPINGNTWESFNADDDGGYFRRRARLYDRRGAIRLP